MNIFLCISPFNPDSTRRGAQKHKCRIDDTQYLQSVPKKVWFRETPCITMESPLNGSAKGEIRLEKQQTENPAIGIYLLIIGLFGTWAGIFIQVWYVVFVSCILNLLVILVLKLRKRKLGPMEVFIIALALADIMFSLIIHPMLIATSFGANPHIIFTHVGRLGKTIFTPENVTSTYMYFIYA